MRNLKLLIEYDGTHYCGWQIQPKLPTVQGTIKRLLEELLGEKVNLKGASRTDSGVHAYGQVANFLTKSDMHPMAIRQSLKDTLPDDIVVKEVIEVSPDFGSRHGAKEKTYIYKIYNSTSETAIHRGRCWLVKRPLSVERMQEAAKHLVGNMDFASFMSAHSEADHSVRDVSSVTVSREDVFIEIIVTGRSFLMHMVRIMAGTLVNVGKGKIDPEDIPEIIEARDRKRAGTTAPAEGLYLVEIKY